MRLNLFQWRSLKTRVTFITLGIFVLGIWTLALYTSRMLHDDMQRLLGQQQFSTVSYMAAELNHELDDRLKALATAANGISPLLPDAPATRQHLGQRAYLQELFNGGVIAYRRDATPVAAFPPAGGESQLPGGAIDAVGWVLRTGKANIGSPSPSGGQGVPSFAMAVPIHDSDGTLQGALAGIISFKAPNFLDQFTHSHYGETGYYLLEDPKNRVIITGSDKNRMMQALPKPGVNPLIDRHVQGFDESGVTVNPLGIEVLASAKRIPIAGWFIVAALPTAEAFAPIRAMQKQMLSATIVLTLLVGLLTWWLVKHQLAPMLAAADRLRAMSDTEQSLQALPVGTPDEVGDLIGGFNHLLETVRQRETEIEIVRQQQFHKEKMAAIGSLAAAVAHEVNNPLTAIVGIAEAIEAESLVHHCHLHEFPCQPRLILEQARRAIAITRQIGNFSMPQSATQELLDLNALVRNTANFINYDSRFLRIKMHLELDPHLPAIYGVADHLTQVVMNLLINAGDALQDCYQAPPEIRISSFIEADRAILKVVDNGQGIKPELLEKVFDEYFTTKVPGKGVGLGLALCRRLLVDSGGDIALLSTYGQGTTATITLPLAGETAQG